MGQVVINGQVVDLREGPLTAADVKRETGSPSGDWVMATLPGGQIVKVPDNQTLPANFEDLSIVVPYEYGCRL